MKKNIIGGIVAIVTALASFGGCGTKLAQVKNIETGWTAGVFTTLAGYVKDQAELAPTSVDNSDGIETEDGPDESTETPINEITASEAAETALEKEEIEYASDILLVKSTANEDELKKEVNSLEPAVDGEFTVNKKGTEADMYYVHIDHEIGAEAMYTLVNAMDKLNTVEEAYFCIVRG